jgi:pimeloyl-ACP methyl ester carboxylesterase
MEQDLRFCTTTDGVRIAYATIGSGPPLVYVCGWPQSIDLELDIPNSRAFLEDLAEGFTLVRYDMRGGGLSDRDVDNISPESSALDLAAVVDHLQLDTFDMVSFGLLAGPIAMIYAAQHPERVRHMVLVSPYLNGEKIIAPERGRALVEYARNFGFPFNDVVSEPFLTRDEVNEVKRIQSAAAGPEVQAKLLEAMFSANVEAIAAEIATPTLVIHSRQDPYIPFDLGREVALRLPNAEFITFDSSSPATWQQRNVVIPELRRFLSRDNDDHQHEADAS